MASQNLKPVKFFEVFQTFLNFVKCLLLQNWLSWAWMQYMKHEIFSFWMELFNFFYVKNILPIKQKKNNLENQLS